MSYMIDNESPNETVAYPSRPDSPSSLSSSLEQQSPVIAIHLDKPCYINTIKCTGLHRTNAKFIEQFVSPLIHIKNYAELFQKVFETKEQLAELGIFRQIDIMIDRGAAKIHRGTADKNGFHTVNLKIELEEKNISFQAGVEIGDQSATGNVSCNFPNVFGKAERLSFKSATPNPGTNTWRDYSLEFQKKFFKSDYLKSFNIDVSRSLLEYPHLKCKNLSHKIGLGLSVDSILGRHQLSLEGDYRQINCDTQTSTFILEQSGPEMKHSVKHSLMVDTRHGDNPINPGIMFLASQEFSGLTPDMNTSRFLKFDNHLEMNIPLLAGLILSVTARAGYLHQLNLDLPSSILDRFYFGGPTTLRGFNLWGVGPRDKNCSLGGNTYFGTGIHLYIPIPYMANNLIGNTFRMQTFATFGSLFNINNNMTREELGNELIDNVRGSIGIGLLWIISLFRIEINWCYILLHKRGDIFNTGLQWGIGIEFL